ncbi:hypothetical protein E1A91_A07G166100v1 [Gossypium mustelinum]|uniref:Uncharacterized protein n=1 Tax=Gossypium mustelinum TaxID=34275 RepID=A0A5D2YLW8_GOSMU|nr:hypothetical protein E1A91_A07G166100v1 [Gossypium mustelinum]
MSVKMRTTRTWTERPYEASLFPGISFGLYLHSLGGRRRRPPSGGARAINLRAKGQSQVDSFYGA